MAHIILRRVV